MKLVIKFLFVLLLILTPLLACNGYLSVKREQELFLTDMKRDAHLIGNTLATSITDIWRTNDIERIFKLIEETNEEGNFFQIHWVWLDVPESNPYYAPVNSEKREAILNGQEVAFRGKVQAEGEYLYTYIPIMIEDKRPAALELSESLTPMHEYTRKSVIRMLFLMGALVLVGSLLVMMLGVSMVGRPIEYLVEQARRVGAGNLTGMVVLKRRRDELTYLADEMNLMIEQLRESKRKLDAENVKRIAILEQLSHAERLAAIGKLSSGIAHELGTPLNVISGRAKIIFSQNLQSSEVIENAHIIKQQSDRMTNIIQQLLSFARRRKPKKKMVNLNKLVNHVITLLNPMSEKHNITISIVDQDITSNVEIDENQIEEIITNLIMNATQAMPHGGKIEVIISREHTLPPADHGGSEGDYLCLKVKDEGEGILKENINRIFDPFFTTKSVGEGTGLGLSIANSTIREHDGWLAVESEPGKGSCFSMYLTSETE